MTTVAILDDKGRLVGKEEVAAKAAAGRAPDPGDLPLDGTYKWTGTAYLPLGAGFGKIPKPPVDFLYVLRALIAAAPDGLPHEVALWAGWYDEHQRTQAEERVVLQRKLGA
jgi:hypothetical protein